MFKSPIFYAFFLAVLPLTQSSQLLHASDNLPGRIWVQNFDGNGYEYRAMAFSKRDNGLWVALSLSEKNSAPDQSILWKINHQGKKIAEISFKEPLGRMAFKVRDMAVDDDGSLLLVGGTSKSRLVIASVTDSGKTQWINDVEGEIRPITSRAIALTEKFLYVVVQRSDGPVLLKLTKEGGIVSERSVGSSNSTFIDAVPRSGGGLALLFNVISGKGSSELVVTILKPDGEISKQHRIQGRFGSVASTPRKDLVLVFDGGATLKEQSIIAQNVDENLSERWRTTLFQGKLGMFPFRIATLNNNDVIIVGPRSNRLSAFRLNDTGRTIWEFTDSKGAISPVFDIEPTVDSYFIAASVMVPTQSGISRFIQLIKCEIK